MIRFKPILVERRYTWSYRTGMTPNGKGQHSMTRAESMELHTEITEHIDKLQVEVLTVKVDKQCKRQ